MRAPRPALAVALLLCVAAAFGCRRDRCVTTCEQRAKELHCGPPVGCKATCEKLHTATACAKELKAFETCFLALPPSDWACDSDSLPVPHFGACPAERHGVETCLESQPTGPAPTPPPPPH